MSTVPRYKITLKDQRGTVHTKTPRRQRYVKGTAFFMYHYTQDDVDLGLYPHVTKWIVSHKHSGYRILKQEFDTEKDASAAARAFWSQLSHQLRKVLNTPSLPITDYTDAIAEWNKGR